MYYRSVTFTLLLFSSLFALDNYAAYAHPVAPNAGLLKVPIQRTPSRAAGLHSHLAQQRRHNRALKRAALLSGRTPPSREDMHRRMLKRAAVLKRQQDAASISVPANNTFLTAAFLKALDTDQPELQTATTPTGLSSTGLDIDGADLEYIATMKMGNPPRDFRLIMDTGSSDLFVGSEICKRSDGQGNCSSRHQFLGPKSSSSFIATEIPWNIQFDIGAVSGRLVSDNVSFAGHDLGRLTFGVADVETPDTAGDDINADGLMGLALAGGSEQHLITPIDALASQGLIRDRIIAMKLGRTGFENDGEISIGGLDPTKFNPQTLVTVPNQDPFFSWTAALEGVTVDGVDTGIKNVPAIPDSGTSLVVAPLADAQAIHKQIPGSQPDSQEQGFFNIPCNTTARVAMVFGGRSFAIDPRDLMIDSVTDDPAGMCLSGVTGDTGQGGGDGLWILGDVWLKNVYLSVNADKNEIGFAELA